MVLQNFIRNFNIFPLDLEDSCHRQIVKNIFEINRKMLVDDYMRNAEQLMRDWAYFIKNGEAIGYLIFVNDEPYGVMYAYIDAYKNATLYASTYDKFDNLHFYTSQRFLRGFLKTLFTKFKVNKVKVEFAIYNAKVEAAMRYVGLRKEGHLKGEGRINGKPITALCLGLTKEDYFNGQKDLEEIKQNIKRIDPGKKRKRKRGKR